MTTDDRERLIGAARRAYLDGWHPWEVPGQVLAQARYLGVRCSEAQAKRIASTV